MFLSKLILNPRSREARRDLANPYELHRTLARAFAPDNETSPARFLWRLEPTVSWQHPILLVQSVYPANWAALADLAYYLHQEIEVKEFEPENWLNSGHIFRFRLQANPTVTRNGKRWGLLKEDEQLAWLTRQGERHGFFLEQALVSASAMQQGRKGEGKLSVLTVTFDGYLRVQEACLLWNAMGKGIGPAKSLGCGLLTLGRN